MKSPYDHTITFGELHEGDRKNLCRGEGCTQELAFRSITAVLREDFSSSAERSRRVVRPAIQASHYCHPQIGHGSRSTQCRCQDCTEPSPLSKAESSVSTRVSGSMKFEVHGQPLLLVQILVCQSSRKKSTVTTDSAQALTAIQE